MPNSLASQDPLLGRAVQQGVVSWLLEPFFGEAAAVLAARLLSPAANQGSIAKLPC